MIKYSDQSRRGSTDLCIIWNKKAWKQWQHPPFPSVHRLVKGLAHCSGSHSHHKVKFHTHILLDSLPSPSHWWSDWRRKHWKGSGQHPVGHLLQPRGRGWAHSPANIYRRCLDALQMLELLVVQWYSQWETLSRQKQGGKRSPKDHKTWLPP
jgi:hypothetical protein